MSLSEAGVEGGTVPQSHVAAGVTVAIVGVLLGNRLGGVVGAVVGLVGGFVIGFAAAAVYFVLLERFEGEIPGEESEGKGKRGGERTGE